MFFPDRRAGNGEPLMKRGAFRLAAGFSGIAGDAGE